MQGVRYFFQKTGCEVALDGKTILRGWRDPQNCLWRVMIVDDGWDSQTNCLQCHQTHHPPLHNSHRTSCQQHANCAFQIKHDLGKQPLQMFQHGMIDKLLLCVSQLLRQVHSHQGYWQRLPQGLAGTNISMDTPSHLCLHRIQNGTHGPTTPWSPIHSTHSNNHATSGSRHLR
jgi:hypothetical protein